RAQPEERAARGSQPAHGRRARHRQDPPGGDAAAAPAGASAIYRPGHHGAGARDGGRLLRFLPPRREPHRSGYRRRLGEGRAGRTVSNLRATGGVAMGVMMGLSYAENSVTLASGDTLLLYTDGISEAMDGDGQEFTEGRLIRSLGESYRESVEIVLSSLIDS